ncbi:MAG: aminotransferase class I/II-fold pyridoxal phosphate-dependent enzyme, partial [Thermoanaerobaculia bacterium]|nr:aminotransferase class I/II-fold pyridoxal phosphate-dependent enzyme [Thermoanaerobaculia bacterium]
MGLFGRRRGNRRREARIAALRSPQFDLGRAAARVRREVESRWARLLDDTAFVGGDEVAAFERTFAAYLGARGAVGVANGTDALELALEALGIEAGDEVVVPAFTFVATAAAVVRAGGRPVLVDVEASTLDIDPVRVEEAVTERTVGVVAVHLYGRPCALG